jgi:hypothetical protein
VQLRTSRVHQVSHNTLICISGKKSNDSKDRVDNLSILERIG